MLNVLCHTKEQCSYFAWISFSFCVNYLVLRSEECSDNAIAGVPSQSCYDIRCFFFGGVHIWQVSISFSISIKKTCLPLVWDILRMYKLWSAWGARSSRCTRLTEASEVSKFSPQRSRLRRRWKHNHSRDALGLQKWWDRTDNLVWCLFFPFFWRDWLASISLPSLQKR